MRKALALIGLLATLLLASMASSASAARIVDRFHGTLSGTFTGDLCGIPGTFVVSGVTNVQVFANGTFKEELRQSVVFTADATGKSVLLFVAQQFIGKGPIDNGDGTVTFVSTFKGLPEKLKLPNGRTLLRDAGTVSFIDTFDAETGEFLRETIDMHGPHPELTSGFTLFCDVIVPAIS